MNTRLPDRLKPNDMKSREKIKPDELQQIHHALQQGEDIYAIADKFNRHWRTIWRVRDRIQAESCETFNVYERENWLV